MPAARLTPGTRKLAWETACLVIPFDGSGKSSVYKYDRGASAGGMEGKGENQKKRNLMKHRLASRGPTGRLWPSFPILLFFSFFFLSGGINAVPPSLSSFHLCIWWGSMEERLSPKLGWEKEEEVEEAEGEFITL